MSTEELLAQLPDAKRKLEVATAQDDPVGMVDTYITYNQCLSQLRKISPLALLRKGDLQSALAHADAYEPDHAILWHLLIVWELKEEGRLEDAHTIYGQLKFKKLSRGVLDHHSDIATIILSQVMDLDEDVTYFLCSNVFTFYTYNDFLHKLIDLGCSAAYSFAERIDGKRLRKCIEDERETKEKSAAGMGAKPATYNSDDILWIEEIEDLTVRERKLSDIAEAMAAAGDFVTALDIADAIEDYETKQLLLRDIAIAQSKNGNISAAFDTLKRFNVCFPLADALLAISAELIRSGDTARARETIVHVLLESIQPSNKYDLINALRNVIAINLKEGQSSSKIKLVLSGIIAYARTITNKRKRSDILIDVACAQGKIGENEEALKTIELAMMVSVLIQDEGMKIPGFCDPRIDALLNVAKGQGKIGFTEAANKTRKIALTAAYTISEPLKCAASLISISKEQISWNDLESAKQTLMIALNIAHKIINKSDRDWTIEKIAKKFAEAKLFPEALKIAQSIEIENDKHLALREIACIAAQQGLISYAYEIREQNPCELHREQILGCIAAAYAKQGDYTSAYSVVDQMDNGSTYRADALRIIGSAQLRRGDYKKVVQSLSLLCDQTKSWSSDPFTVDCIERIAITKAQAGLAGEALRTAERINVFQHIHLPNIAAAFAEKGDKVSFKKLFADCVYFENTADRVIGLVAKLYPDSALEIMELLLRKLDERDQFSS
jgi:hypothetical protein